MLPVTIPTIGPVNRWWRRSRRPRLRSGSPGSRAVSRSSATLAARARRSSTGSRGSLTAAIPRRRAAARTSRRRRSCEKWTPRARGCAARSRGSAPSRQHGRERRRIIGGQPPEAERPDLVSDRVAPDRDGASVDRRLDRWVAEALPRRGKDDGVARGVAVRHVIGARGRSENPHLRWREQPVEVGPVALLGRAGQPVGGAERLGEGERGGHVLALDGRGPGGGGAARAGATPSRARVSSRSTRLVVDVERVVRSWWRRCRPGEHLGARSAG